MAVRSLLILVGLVVVIVTSGASPLRDAVIEKLRAGQIVTVADFPDHSAEELLGVFYWTMRSRGNLKVAAVAGRSIEVLPGAEDWFRLKLRAVPFNGDHLDSFDIYREREQLLTALSYTKNSRWALDLVGEVFEVTDSDYALAEDLRRDYSMHFELGLDWMESIAGKALLSLAWDSPYPGRRGYLDLGHLRQWWIDNKHRPDSFFFEPTLGTLEIQRKHREAEKKRRPSSKALGPGDVLVDDSDDTALEGDSVTSWAVVVAAVTLLIGSAFVLAMVARSRGR